MIVSTLQRLCAGLITLALGPLGGVLAAPALAQTSDDAEAGRHEIERTQIEDWNFVCIAAPEGGETARRCRINTHVFVADDGDASNRRLILAVVVQHVGEARTPVMAFRLPPAAGRAEALQIWIDDGPRLTAPQPECSENECRFGLRLNDELLDRLRAGLRLHVGFALPVEGEGEPRGVQIPASLKGFTRAYATLANSGA